MRVHQMPPQPEQVRPEPPPKPAEAARQAAIFEEMANLKENERPRSDRKPPRREQPRPAAQKAKPLQPSTATASGPATTPVAARPGSSKLDILA